jgi:uncharacterized membrane protein
MITSEKGRRWEGNIKICLKGTRFDAGDWNQLAQYRVQSGSFVNTVLNLRVP